MLHLIFFYIQNSSFEQIDVSKDSFFKVVVLQESRFSI